MLQALIVVVIVAVTAAIALPVYASKAKDAVLQQNAAALKTQVQSFLAQGLDSRFVPDGGTEAGGGSVSGSLARALRSGEAGRFVNPRSGGTAILCQSEPPKGAAQARPAVLITDDRAAAHSALSASGESGDLAGTLLVVFAGHDGDSDSTEVFFIDPDGRPSTEVATLTR